MSLLLGLLVAASFGTGDFFGGLSSRRLPTLVVLAVAQSCALVGAVVVALLAGGSPSGADLLTGAVAGLLNVAAVGCLYRGLAVGRIGVVAPIAAVIGAVIPVAWGLATGERPGVLALVGVALAVGAAGLISTDAEESEGGPDRRALLLAVGAGVGFGSSFVCFALTAHDSGAWPVLTARVAAVIGVGLVLLVTRTRPTWAPGPGGQAVAAGLLDVTATALLLVAVRSGLAAVVAPVASLAPGFTVAHARWYLHERAGRLQVVGLAVALVGLALIASG